MKLATCETCGDSFIVRVGCRGRFCSNPCRLAWFSDNRRGLTVEEFLADCRGNQRPGCWEWSAAKSSKGYGVVRLGGRQQRVHRVAYMLEIGPVTPGLAVCHRCDNPPCLRPAHLFLGTDLANMQDAARKGRMAAGNRNPSAKLTEDAARAIRLDTRPDRVLAAEFGVSRRAISFVKQGLTWKGA